MKHLKVELYSMLVKSQKKMTQTLMKTEYLPITIIIKKVTITIIDKTRITIEGTTEEIIEVEDLEQLEVRSILNISYPSSLYQLGIPIYFRE